MSELVPPSDGAMAVAADFALAMLDRGPDLCVALDADGRVVIANETAHTLLGARAGLDAREVLPRAAMEALGGARVDPEPLHRHGDRLIRWECPRFGSVGGVRWLVGRDLTEQEAEAGALIFRLRRLELVQSITVAVARGDRLHDIFELTLRELAELVPILQAGIVLLADDVFTVVYRYAHGRSLPTERRVPVGESPASRVLGRREPVQLFPDDSDAARYPQLASMWADGIRSILYVPMIAEGRTLGLVSIGSSLEGGLSADEIDAVVEAASQLATALLRQRLMDQIAEHQRELEDRVRQRTRDLEQTRDQLVAAARLSTLGQLAAGLAHELNQPLNVVGGYIELLQDPSFTGRRRSDVLDVMATAVDRMAGLVRHLRNYARPAPLELRSVDLREVVRMALELSRRAAAEVQVRFRPPDEPLVVQGDAARLEQVIINLLTNARLATRESGGTFVDVDMGREGERVFVRVRDEGPGVAPEVQDSIFEPFFSTRASGEGMGLGLSISQRIAEQHGGVIELEPSERGASFRLLLPS